jgi:TIM21
VVVYYLTVAVFLPTSETAVFSKAFDRVRNDSQVAQVLSSLIVDETTDRGENEGVWRELTFTVGKKSTDCV